MTKKKTKLKKGSNFKAQSRDKVSLPPTTWDQGPNTPAQRDGKVMEPRGSMDTETGDVINPNNVTGARRQPWVERYFHQGRITEAQHVAGKVLYELNDGSGARDPLEAIGDVRGTGNADPQAAAMDRRARFFDVWREIPAALRVVLERVVLNDMPVSTATDGIHWRDRKQQMGYLRDGLDMVAARISG